MYWPTSIEGYVFWMINFYVAMLVLFWICIRIAAFLEHRHKLRKNLSFWGLSTLGIIYLYCMFSYIMALG